MALAQSFLTKPAASRFGERACVMLGNAIRALFYALAVVIVEPWVPYVSCIGLISAGALITPCMTAAISRLSPESIRGSIIGAFNAVGCLGNFIGPLAGGAVFVHHVTWPFTACVVLS